MVETDSHAAFKGAQAPLVFKGFKGRFIYIGGGVGIGGFVVAAILITTVGAVVGVIALCSIWALGYVYISVFQKKGLHTKNKEKGTFIVVNKYHIRKLEHYTYEKKENI